VNVMVVGTAGPGARTALESARRLELVDPPDVRQTAGTSEIGRITAAIRAFEAGLGSLSVQRVVLIGASDLALAAVLVASKLRVPVAAIEAGFRDSAVGEPAGPNRRVIEQLADVVLADDPAALGAWLAGPRPPSSPGDGH
jgi:UDP-N-acetylglucosamine 2-epimerase